VFLLLIFSLLSQIAWPFVHFRCCVPFFERLISPVWWAAGRVNNNRKGSQTIFKKQPPKLNQ